MNIGEQISKVATELGLPAGKVLFDGDAGEWRAQVVVQKSVLHLAGSVREGFWASIEQEKKKIPIYDPPSWGAFTDQERKIKYCLELFRDHLAHAQATS